MFFVIYNLRKGCQHRWTILSEIALRIYGDLNSVTAICKEIRKSIVPDDEFTAAFNTWSGSNREIIRYILRKINKQISPTDELNLNNSDVHIEHVMPIENSKWKIPEDTHNEYLWRLGNLTLLSGKLNIQISNEVFPIKVSEYAKSKIDLNKSLCTCSMVLRAQNGSFPMILISVKNIFRIMHS